MSTRLILAVLALAVCLPGTASGDPILLTPSGTTLNTGQIRAEAALSPDNDNGRFFWLTVGGPGFEVGVTRFENPAGSTENLLGVQWCFIPETFITPAVSFGVRDIASQSAEGISGYGAITKRLPVDKFVPFVRDFSATVGLGAGGIRGPFFGIDTRLPLNLFVQAEYDSRDINAAAGWQPVKNFRVKAYNIRSELYFGAELLPMAF